MSQVCLSPSKKINTEHLIKATINPPLEEQIKELAKPVLVDTPLLKENITPISEKKVTPKSKQNSSPNFRLDPKNNLLIFEDRALLGYSKTAFWKDVSSALKNDSSWQFCSLQKNIIERADLEKYSNLGVSVHPLDLFNYHNTFKSTALDPLTNQFTQLTKAVILNNENLVKKELKKHPINQPDSAGRNALQWAAYFNHDQIVLLLLKSGADPHYHTTLHPPAILQTIYCNQTEAAQVLLDGYVDVNAPIYTITPLSHAVSLGSETMCRFFIKQGADINNPNALNSPLSIAAIKGDTVLAKLLLGLGADINLSTSDLAPPIIHAIRANQFDMVKFLIKNKADVNNAITLKTPLIIAINEGRLDIARLLLERGADVNLSNSDSNPALFHAIYSNNLDMVQLLIDHKADVNFINENIPFPPLSFAAILGNIAIGKILLQHGANINLACSSTGWTPLMHSIDKGHAQFAKFLIDRQGTNLHHISPINELTAYLISKAFPTPNAKEIRKFLKEKDPSTEIFSRFFKLTKLIGHWNELEGVSNFKKDNLDIIIKRESFILCCLGHRMIKDMKNFTSILSGKFSKNFATILLDTLEPYFQFPFDIEKAKTRSLDKKPILIPTGMKGHTVALLIWEDYVVLCNRGLASKKSLQIFKYPKDLLQTTEFIKDVSTLIKEDQKDYEDFFFNKFASQCDPNGSLETSLESLIGLPLQPSGNCSLASTQQALLALMSLEALKRLDYLKPEVPFINLITTIDDQKQLYENFEAFSKIVQLEKYARFTKQHPDLADQEFNTLPVPNENLFPPIEKRSMDLRIQRVSKKLNPN